MKTYKFLSFALIALTVSAILFTGCSKDDDEIATPDDHDFELAFVGSDECRTCHEDQYNIFIKSGHPYKLNKIENGLQPVIPYTTAEGLDIPLPTGYTWDDVTYMIGGYGWKSRWTDADGFIITAMGDAQYNLADGSQVNYSSSSPLGTKKYDCGKCHTTGWKHVDDGGKPQDGLLGMAGEFFAGGIHCEECHGMGNLHVATQRVSDINIDSSPELCGRCHTRNADRSIAAKGGFVKHHEQYDEWLVSGGHNKHDIDCNSCHDPHASVINDDIAPGNGVTKSCTDCHDAGEYNANKHDGASLDCITCHMPYSGKSALKLGKYVGDVRSHMFKINPSTQYNQFSSDGKLANPEGISLDFACYQCHKDNLGEGGNASQVSKLKLASMAFGFHDN